MQLCASNIAVIFKLFLMKQKSTILFLILCFLFLPKTNINAQCGREAKIQLSTGINYQGGTHYLANLKDEYWSIEQGPIGPQSKGFNFESSDFPPAGMHSGQAYVIKLSICPI